MANQVGKAQSLVRFLETNPATSDRAALRIQVRVHPLSCNLQEPKDRIRQSVEATATGTMLKEWDTFRYRSDVDRVTREGYIEHL
jgi:hypothetical protein